MANNGRSVAEGVSPFGEAHNYFINNVLPNNIQARERRVSSPTPYTHNRDQTFILVKNGTGTLTVNGVDYALRPATLVSLGPFHRYRYIPGKGQTLELAESRMNSGTYMYLTANPYFRLNKLEVPSEPPVVYLKGLKKEIAFQSMDGLLLEAESDSKDKNSLCLCYMTDLFGIVADIGSKGASKKNGR